MSSVSRLHRATAIIPLAVLSAAWTASLAGVGVGSASADPDGTAVPSGTVPDWVHGPERLLERPFFAGGLESLKAVFLVESPLAFRRRQIFVSANALSRPRDAEASATELRSP